MKELWPKYVDQLIDVCHGMGIDVIDLNKIQYPGWCFIDPVHMIDIGYEKVAEHISGNIK